MTLDQRSVLNLLLGQTTDCVLHGGQFVAALYGDSCEVPFSHSKRLGGLPGCDTVGIRKKIAIRVLSSGLCRLVLLGDVNRWSRI